MIESQILSYILCVLGAVYFVYRLLNSRRKSTSRSETYEPAGPIICELSRCVVSVLPSADIRKPVCVSPLNGGRFCGPGEPDALEVEGAAWISIRVDGTAVVEFERLR